MSKIFKLSAIGALMITVASAASTALCIGCHGAEWEKKAMGVSKIVKNMSKVAIIEALKGYKNASYGGTMKGLMAKPVAKLSTDDMEKIASEIKK